MDNRKNILDKMEELEKNGVIKRFKENTKYAEYKLWKAKLKGYELGYKDAMNEKAKVSGSQKTEGDSK